MLKPIDFHNHMHRYHTTTTRPTANMLSTTSLLSYHILHFPIPSVTTHKK